MKKTVKIVSSVFLFALVVFGIFVAFTSVLISGNFKLLVVQSGSMEPAIHTGSLIVVRSLADYNVGDIITRKTEEPKVTITHRIFSKEELDGEMVFETKGDANNAPDFGKFTFDKIIGKEISVLPYAGYLVNYAKTVPGLILLIVIPAVLIVYDELNKIKTEIRKMMKEEN